MLYVVEQQGGIHSESRVDRGRKGRAVLLGDDSRRNSHRNRVCRHYTENSTAKCYVSKIVPQNSTAKQRGSEEKKNGIVCEGTTGQYVCGRYTQKHLPSSSTMEQAPIFAPSPILMGPRSVAPAPSKTLFPTVGCL
jgi:hypothetical protein